MLWTSNYASETWNESSSSHVFPFLLSADLVFYFFLALKIPSNVMAVFIRSSSMYL